MISHLLTLAFTKTEVVVSTRKWIPSVIPARVADEMGQSKPTLKYFGAMIDSKFISFEQTRRKMDKRQKE